MPSFNWYQIRSSALFIETDNILNYYSIMILSLLNASQINNNYLVLGEVYSKSDGFSSIFKKFRQFFNTKIFFGIRFTEKVQNRMWWIFWSYSGITTQSYYIKDIHVFQTTVELLYKDTNNNLM